MTRIRTLASLAAAALAIPIGAGVATAQQLDHGTYHETFTRYRSCANGLDLRIDGENNGKFNVIQRGDGTWGYAAELVDNARIVTNVATGASFTIRNKGLVFKDQFLIDNGDGTSTLLVNSPAAVFIYAPDGKIAFQETGLAVYRFLVTGDDVQYIDAVAAHGFNNVPEGDNCDMAAYFWL